MTGYRRNFVPGGSYFFTVNLADRRLALLTENIESLRAAFRYARHQHPFTIDAIVVLPDHLHTIWTMPEGDSDFAVRWSLIKGSFSRRIPQGEPVSDSRLRRRARGIWWLPGQLQFQQTSFRLREMVSFNQSFKQDFIASPTR